MKRIILTTFLFLAFLVYGCSDDNSPSQIPLTPELENPLPEAALVPDHAPPAGLIEIHGMDALSADHEWSATIGGITVPLMKNNTTWSTLAPMIYAPGDSTWPIASATALTFVLYQDGAQCDSLSAALQVDALERADGTGARIVTNLGYYLDGVENFTGHFAPDDTLMFAVLAAAREIISTGENSLSALLSGDAPLLDGQVTSVELTDALLASSGVAAGVEAMCANM